MGKEDRFVASISALDGNPRFLHNSFQISGNLSSVTGKKISAKSLLLNPEKHKDFAKSFDSSIESKKKNDRLSGPDPDSIEAKKLKRKGAFEVNKEKVADFDAAIQKRRLAKSYDFTSHKSSMSLETYDESSKKFKVETPLEAEVSRLLLGSNAAANGDKNTNPFFRDHSKDLKAARMHLAEISKARRMARQKEAKDRHQSKIKSKRYRRALRKAKQEEKAKQQPENSEEALAKADLARAQERASLKHKTISKKLRFYDQTNTKESEVRRTQNLESQRLRAKVESSKDDSSSDDNREPEKEEEEDKVFPMPKTPADLISKRIDPNNFVQAAIKSVSDDEDEESADEEEEDAFTADISTFDSGIEMEQNELSAKKPKSLPGWGSWSSAPKPVPKKMKQKTRPKKFKHALVLKDAKTALGEHQLPRVPHPFRNLDDCQAELAQPIGDTFMPKTTVIKATKPKVHVKLGAMIEPDARDEI